MQWRELQFTTIQDGQAWLAFHTVVSLISGELCCTCSGPSNSCICFSFLMWSCNLNLTHLQLLNKSCCSAVHSRKQGRIGCKRVGSGSSIGACLINVTKFFKHAAENETNGSKLMADALWQDVMHKSSNTLISQGQLYGLFVSVFFYVYVLSPDQRCSDE